MGIEGKQVAPLQPYLFVAYQALSFFYKKLVSSK